MRRVRLTYLDDNPAFCAVLPRTGAVCGTIRLDGRDLDWHIVSLAEPIDYNGRRHDRLLIASRWEGYEIGGPDPTAVFILLIDHPAALDKARPRSADFAYVGQGMAYALDREPGTGNGG